MAVASPRVPTRTFWRNDATVDPVAERELREWAFSLPEVDRAFEEMAEFAPGGRKEERWEQALTHAERHDVDYHEQILHPPSEPGQVW